jgi:DNA polymerase I-like protein with 3'-5' exonuclease and polymerase domains
MAMELYLLEKNQVSHDSRYSAKNGFVFPQFYGDYYVNCAKALWSNIDKLNLRIEDEEKTSLKKHLSTKGIQKYEQFERHVGKVETKFWEEQFPQYAEWKHKWVAAYHKKGFFETLIGFRCNGPLERNKIINYPIQGTAFHTLLWSAIQMSKRIGARHAVSQLIAQIHDCILLDSLPNELPWLVETAREIMREEIRKHWPWIVVPLDIEIEVTPIDTSWFEKEKLYS